MMHIADEGAFRQHRDGGGASGEVFLVMLLFASMGAITWAIRGTNGWSGIDGTIVPGMTWGVLWWYVCWRRGIDARGVPLWLAIGIALGGEWGYGQYVSWIRGTFHVGDEVAPIAPWIGYSWFANCGIAWGAPGGIALGWALAGRKTLGIWLARLTVPVGAALLARGVVQTWPWMFFPKWQLGVYVAESAGTIDVAAASSAQTSMIVAWVICALIGVIGWLTAAKSGKSLPARAVSFLAVATVVALLLCIADWLFFPADQLGLIADELGDHLGRTLYTNSQNAIVVGWWIGAMFVAALGQDRQTLVAGLVIGAGFGIGFPLSAVWCLGYEYAPGLVDWWKMWELQSGVHLGLLYVVVLYWTMRQIDGEQGSQQDATESTDWRWCETIAMAAALFVFVYITAREEFPVVGILLGAFYVVAMLLATSWPDQIDDRRLGITLIYSVFLLVFILTWGASSQTGILLGLYEDGAVGQYAWSPGRTVIFAPMGILIVAAAVVKTWQVVRDPSASRPPLSTAPRVSARLMDLMTLTGAVGAATIWPAKIGVLYALFLAAAIFALNRLNRRFDATGAS